MHEVKIFKPDKNGKLIQKERISDEDLSKIHWSNFGADVNRAPNKNRPKEAQRLGVSYHRIGVPLKECIEKGCTKLVEDPRNLTCSVECRKSREKQQRIEQRIKATNNTIICKACKNKFIGRKDKLYCSKSCRPTRRKHGKPDKEF
tara:strand:+ start:583 stop:1020 length:438 start_codon:yes stop_codon:yes gene_type:complete